MNDDELWEAEHNSGEDVDTIVRGLVEKLYSKTELLKWRQSQVIGLKEEIRELELALEPYQEKYGCLMFQNDKCNCLNNQHENGCLFYPKENSDVSTV